MGEETDEQKEADKHNDQTHVQEDNEISDQRSESDIGKTFECS